MYTYRIQNGRAECRVIAVIRRILLHSIPATADTWVHILIIYHKRDDTVNGRRVVFLRRPYLTRRFFITIEICSLFIILLSYVSASLYV